MITTRDDGLVRTHDEAQSLIRAAVPGARVVFDRIARPGDAGTDSRARRYTVLVERAGWRRVTDGDVYSLPCVAQALARRARDVADAALTAAGAARPLSP